MKSAYRVMTDHVKRVLGDVDYVLITSISKMFTYDHIKKCVDRFPRNKLEKMKPRQKSSYLFGICKKTAGSSDYRKTTSRILNADGFSL